MSEVDGAAGSNPAADRTSPVDADARREWALAGVDVVRAANRDDSLPEVFGHIATHALALLDMDMCAVMLLDPQTSRLMVVGSAGLSGSYIRQLHADHPLTVDRTGATTPSPSVEAFVTGRTVAVADIALSAGMANWRQLALSEGYSALIATPLSEGDRTNGVLVGYSRSKRHFPSEQVVLLEMFAVHAGATIHSAHRRDELQDTIDKLHSANAVLRRQRRDLEVVDRQHRRLLQVMANDVGISGVVSMVAELLDCSVTVEDYEGNVITTATSGPYVSPPRGAHREAPAIARSLEKVMAARSGSVSIPAPDGLGPRFWVCPVTLHNEVVALLWVGRPGFELDNVGRFGLERFALAVALEISKQRNAVQLELRLSRDLMADLLVETAPRHSSAILERAAALGYDLETDHVVMVARQDPSPGAAGLRQSPADVADRVVKSTAPGTLVGAASGDAVLLAPANGSPTAVEIAESIRADYRRRNPGHTVSVVVGGEVRAISEIAPAFRVARGALDLFSRRRRDTVSRIGDLGVASLLLSHGDPRALKQFADRLLGPLNEIEFRRADELIETLKIWLEEDRSTNRTAERLVVHVNTVGYRLKTLEQRLGRSLRDPAFLVDLQMALAIQSVGALSHAGSGPESDGKRA